MPNAELELRATAKEPEEQEAEADDMRPETLGEAPVGTMLVRTTSFTVGGRNLENLNQTGAIDHRCG